jgi:hypothetical protein
MAGPQPINERFAENQYSGGIPLEENKKTYVSNARVTYEATKNNLRRTKNAATRTAGSAIQMTGMTMRAAGKSAKATGDAATRAGIALSETGIGAVAGVPLAIGGRILGVAGVAAETGGAATSRAGRFIKRRGGKRVDVVASAGVVTTVIFSASWIVWLWLMLQVPFALMASVFFGLGYGVRVLGNNFFESLRGMTIDAIADAISSWLIGPFGSGLMFIADGLFWLCWIIALSAGALQILGLTATLAFRGYRPMSGSGGAVKFVTLLVCFIGYCIPIANLFPWVFLYMLVMVRYPR